MSSINKELVMSTYENYSGGVYRSAAGINQAMARVYGHMGLAVLVSMVVSFLVGNSPDLMAVLFGTGLKWVLFLQLNLVSLCDHQTTVAA